MKKDPTAEERKKDHIELALKSQIGQSMLDGRFYYEPVLAAHPTSDADISKEFLGFRLRTPIWVSSMTGGTEMAKTINTNLAKACGEYGMGMGLGSCRPLLESDERLSDFDMRSYMPNQPLYANLGIAQIEELQIAGKARLINEMLNKLQANGLIVHVNPLQEWLQPEGDRFASSPLDVIKRLIDSSPAMHIIVKEVGQGMGPNSLKALYEIPIQAVDFASAGGTNFAKLELHRSSEKQNETFGNLCRVGHHALDMVHMANEILEGENNKCSQTIISGGIQDYLDGYYLTSLMRGPSIYGQASAFLKQAQGGYDTLQEFIESQIKGLQIANFYLRPRI